MADSAGQLATPETAPLIAAERERLKSLSTDQLRGELSQGLGIAAHNLLRLAAIVRELEERGEDLTELRLGMSRYLRKIAYGQVLPDVVVRFGEYPSLVNHVSSLPIPDQRRLASGQPIELAVHGEQGPDFRLVDPLVLTRDQMQQVFAKDRLRPLHEQLALLEDRREKALRQPSRRRRGRVRADAQRGVVLLSRTAFEPADILDALAELQGETDSSPEDRTITVAIKLTEEEHQQLKERAVSGRTTITDLVRRALKAGGLI